MMATGAPYPPPTGPQGHQGHQGPNRGAAGGNYYHNNRGGDRNPRPNNQFRKPYSGHQSAHSAPHPNSGSSGPLALRLILTRDEVNYLFGFDGRLLQQLREQTDCHIELTNPVSIEQICTFTGSVELILKAFSLICRKLWDFITGLGPGPQGNGPRPLVVRLAVHASQCGSIIGKQGATVREIRDATKANIQVSQGSLEDSSERCVEISGSGESCLQCVYRICDILEKTPMRGEFVPYVPKAQNLPQPFQNQSHQQSFDSWKPVFLCGDKAYVIDGDRAVPAPPELLRKELGKTPLGNEMMDTLINSRGSSSGNGGYNSMNSSR